MEMINAKAKGMGLLRIEIRTVVAALAIASVPIAPALFGLRGGAFVQAALGILLCIMSPNMKFSKIALLYLVFIGWLLCGTLYSNETSFSLFLLLGSGLLASLAVSCSLADQLKEPRERLSFYSTVFTWSTILVCLYCLAVEGLTDRLGREVFEDGGTYIYLSLNILISGLFALWKAVYPEEAHGGAIVWLQLVLIALFCMLSSTRKVILGLAACAVFLITYKNKVKPFRLALWLLAIAALLAGAVYLVMTVPELQQTVGYRFESMVAALLDEGSDASMSERDNLRNYAIALFMDNQIIGIGTEAFREYAGMAFGRYLYSHCNYTELLCNNGIIGFVLYYTIYALVIIESFRHEDAPIRAFTLCSCATLIVLDYSQVSYYQVPYIMFLFTLYTINQGCRKSCTGQSKQRVSQFDTR